MQAIQDDKTYLGINKEPLKLQKKRHQEREKGQFRVKIHAKSISLSTHQPRRCVLFTLETSNLEYLVSKINA